MGSGENRRRGSGNSKHRPFCRKFCHKGKLTNGVLAGRDMKSKWIFFFSQVGDTKVCLILMVMISREKTWMQDREGTTAAERALSMWEGEQSSCRTTGGWL